MKRLSLLSFFSIYLFLFLGGCGIQKPSVQKDGQPEPLERAIVDVEDVYKPAPDGMAIFYTPHMNGNPENLLEILTENPDLKLTLVFPPNYFKQPESRKEFLPAFKALQSSGIIEIGLTLENEPILPLLTNIKLAGGNVKGWDFKFAWPNDISAQIARGSGIYQKRWGKMPSGFLPPFLSLSDPVLKALKGFRLNWVVAKPEYPAGVRFYKGTALFRPEIKPRFEEGSAESRAWVDAYVDWVLNQPFVYINSGLWDSAKTEINFLEKLSRKVSSGRIPLDVLTASELAQSIGDDHLLPEDLDLFNDDFSPWVKSSYQRLAWQALAEARQTVENYKNSGRANLKRLDAALEEIFTAESGPFLLALGQSEIQLVKNQRLFLATLANVYRLCGKKIPKGLNRWFSKRRWRRAQSSSKRDGQPFFVAGEKILTWNDPIGDDNGEGNYTYPLGRYPKGSFDLKKVSIQWTDNNVTFSITLRGLPLEKVHPILPMVDIYVDVNRLTGAGSTDTLKKRQSASIDKEAAWEYAVSFSPTSGALYQSVPGKDARKLLILQPRVNSKMKKFSVVISRKKLRGSPQEWRISVGLMGMEGVSTREEPIPVPILNQSGEKNFGGIVIGRKAPPYVDILAKSIQDQVKRLKPYAIGRQVTLPFVEVQ